MASTKYNYKKNLKSAYNYMVNDLGYSDIVARALIGNFMQESNLNPNAKNNIGAFGIGQWLGSRKKELMKQPNWKTLKGQLDFMHKEFQTTEKKAWNNLQKADNLNEATEIVRKQYERPGKDEANDKRRKRYANFDDNFDPQDPNNDANLYEEDRKFIEGFGKRNYIEEAKKQFKEENPEVIKELEAQKKVYDDLKAKYDEFERQETLMYGSQDAGMAEFTRHKTKEEAVKARVKAFDKMNEARKNQDYEKVKEHRKEWKELNKVVNKWGRENTLDITPGLVKSLKPGQRLAKGYFHDQIGNVSPKDVKKIDKMQMDSWRKWKKFKEENPDIEDILKEEEKKYQSILSEVESQYETRSQDIAKSATEEFKSRKDRHSQMEKDAKLVTEADEIIKDAENESSVNDFDAALAKFQHETSDEIVKKDEFVYDPKDFKKKLPIEAIGYGALGLMGSIDANKSLPRYEDEVDMATLAYLEETKRLKERGIPVAVEAKVKRDLNAAYKVGMENITRASGGNRNLVLGNQAGLEIAKSKGLTNLSIADQEAKDKAFEAYGETLRYIDKFERDKNKINHSIDMREVSESRADGKALANTAFATMMDEIQYQKENSPGSANHMFTTFVHQKMLGQSPDSLPNTPGSAEAAAKRHAEENAYRENHNENVGRRTSFFDFMKGQDFETKRRFQDSSVSMDELFQKGVTDLDGLNTALTPGDVPEVPVQPSPEMVNPAKTQYASTLDELIEMNRGLNFFK